MKNVTNEFISRMAFTYVDWIELVPTEFGCSTYSDLYEMLVFDDLAWDDLPGNVREHFASCGDYENYCSDLHEAKNKVKAVLFALSCEEDPLRIIEGVVV